jgi:hypothetical protein
MYLVQWLDYPDREHWIEEQFEHIMTVLETLGEFYKSNPNMPRTLASRTESIYTFFLGLSPLRLFNDILNPGGYFFLLLTSRFFVLFILLICKCIYNFPSFQSSTHVYIET